MRVIAAALVFAIYRVSQLLVFCVAMILTTLALMFGWVGNSLHYRVFLIVISLTAVASALSNELAVPAFVLLAMISAVIVELGMDSR